MDEHRDFNTHKDIPLTPPRPDVHSVYVKKSGERLGVIAVGIVVLGLATAVALGLVALGIVAVRWVL
jgi:hypothetical protein